MAVRGSYVITGDVKGMLDGFRGNLKQKTGRFIEIYMLKCLVRARKGENHETANYARRHD